jgi:hypothetical protein
MKRYQTAFLRSSMIAMVAFLWLQTATARKADAFADAGTSSGMACLYECNDVFKDCWHHVYSNPTCFDARDYCDFNCEHYGVPFKLWWLFKPK